MEYQQNDNYNDIVSFEREIFNNRHRSMEFIRCIMEILHNAIDAQASHINIQIMADTENIPVKILIYNNGKEIKKNIIDKILRDGYSTREKNEKNVQGKFGVGAALACQNLSNKTTVTSKNEEEYYECESDWIDMIQKNERQPYIRTPYYKNKELYQNFGNKGVLFSFEALRPIVTKYTKQELEERLERCIKTTFFDIGNKFYITINNNEINEKFDISSITVNPKIEIKCFHYKNGREFITIFNEKDVGSKKDDSYVTYNRKRISFSKDVLDKDSKFKFCGSSIIVGTRITPQEVEKEIDFWKGCNYYQDIKHNDLSGSTFVRNNVSLNQNMERLPWDNNDYGDDQIRWKIIWNNNEELDNIMGVETIKIIKEDTKHSCDQNFRWTLKAAKSRGRSYLNMLISKVRSIPQNVQLKDKNIQPESDYSDIEEDESNNSKLSIKRKKNRKGFSKNIQEMKLKNNNGRCYITGTKLMSYGIEGAIKEDDHYDGNSENNSLDNYHPTTVWAHKIKTKHQNRYLDYKKRGKDIEERESLRIYENNINGGYQKLHIKEIGYALESLNSTFIDNNGNKRNYENYEEDIIELYTKALKEINPELKKTILLNLK
jgi:hypothetical protein